MSQQKSLSCLALSVVATTLCWAQSPTQDDPRAADKHILHEIQESNQVMENIEYLSDAIGPRLTGSEQLKTAEAWAANVARQYSLENVHLEAWKIAHSWQRGTAQAQIVKPVLHTLIIASAGWSPSTNGLVRGNVVYVAVTKRDELQAYTGKLRGAIVIYDKPAELISQEPANGPYSGPDVQAPKPPERRTPPGDEKFHKERRSFLKGEGVAAVLYDSGKHNALLTISNVADDYEFREAVPTAMLTHEDYSLVWRFMQKGDVEIQIALANSFSDAPVEVHNVVAEIRGTDKLDEGRNSLCTPGFLGFGIGFDRRRYGSGVRFGSDAGDKGPRLTSEAYSQARFVHRGRTGRNRIT